MHNDRGTIGTERNPKGCLHRTGRGPEINGRVTPDKECATSPPGLQASLLVEVRTEEFRATDREKQAIPNEGKWQRPPNSGSRNVVGEAVGVPG